MTPDLAPPAAIRPADAALAALATLLALLLWQRGLIGQWPDYHAFADRRAWLGVPNIADVASNLPFALVGAWGWWRLRHGGAGPAQLAWRAFCAALIATAAGSTLYHLAPDNASLVADRLPIATACAALLCAFLAERRAPVWGRPGVLAAAVGMACLSVLWWWWGEWRGTGDLRPYLYVQFLPMLLVPAALLLRLGANRPGVTAASAWWAVLALYAAAKGVELADRPIYDTLGLLSGHTLKHLLAGAAAWCIVRAALRTAQLR